MSSALQKVKQRIAKSRATSTEESTPKKNTPWRVQQVERTPEFLRIANLPTRDWEDNAEELARQMTELLKTPKGTQQLRPVQAAALHDLGVYGGVVCIVRVGGGKTLISFLAPYVVESVRPLLVVPGCLKGDERKPGKTERDLERYRWHWRIPQFIRIVSYEWLALKDQVDFFDRYKPDLVMFDEGHRVKNTRAVVTKRYGYYHNDCAARADYPNPRLLIMSGTLTKDSLRDYWHLLRWTLPSEMVPMPRNFPELMQWATALDARVKDVNRVQPGAILDLCNDEEKDLSEYNPLKAARQAYKRRLHATPGMVCTKHTWQGASLRIEERRLKPPEEILRAFTKLRADNETPDGWVIQDASVAAQRAMELALGFYLRWNPRPPAEWMIARSEWCSTCRKIISWNRSRLDSEAQVKDAILKDGRYPEHREKLEKWLELKPTFEPNVETMWVSDFALERAMRWGEKNRGVIWVYHPAVGERLSKLSGMPYYHEGGHDADGNYIESHPRGEPFIASILSNMAGKNLQEITDCALMMYTPSSGEWWEQLIGRIHREGQESDEVRTDVLVTCIEHVVAFWKARGDGEYIEDSALSHKLLFADIAMPQVSEVLAQGGSLWTEFNPDN